MLYTILYNRIHYHRQVAQVVCFRVVSALLGQWGVGTAGSRCGRPAGWGAAAERHSGCSWCCWSPADKRLITIIIVISPEWKLWCTCNTLYCT